MINRKRIIATGLALLILLTVAISVCVTMIEAAHDCDGIDCHVCAIIHMITGTLRGLTAGAAVLLFAVFDPLTRCPRKTAAVLFPYGTPVTHKVRLLN